MIKMPRGTQDILPQDSAKWRYIENRLHTLMELYNYKEIRTPIFESTELFARGVGDSTDVVQKEMYTFKDKGDRSLTLRPEGTAAVVRSYIEHKMQGEPNQPIKLYYNGPMFRYERKQKGRYRQFNQFGVEAIGAEYNEALVKHFEPVIDTFCSDCQSRLHTNPMRILDCKIDRDKEAVKNAPRITDYLNNDSKSYYEQVKLHLDNLNISYVEDPNLVRGLDYYTHTAFELMIDNPEYDGAITTLCGGGRYNGLLQLLDGPDETGIGFALSIERLLMALDEEGISLDVSEDFDLFVVTMGEDADRYAVKLINDLRRNGIKVDKDYLNRKIKGQMKQADRLNAKYTVVIGDQELENNEIGVKNMISGESENVQLDELVNYFKSRKEV